MMRAVTVALSCALVVALVGCSRPDRSKAHEYIQIHAFSPSALGPRLNDVSSGAAAFMKWDSNYFEMGSGGCERKLASFKDDEIRQALRSWNQAVAEHQVNQVAAVAFHLQCVAILGTDKKCVQEYKEQAKLIEDSERRVDFLRVALSSCDARQQVGDARAVQLYER